MFHLFLKNLLVTFVLLTWVLNIFLPTLCYPQHSESVGALWLYCSFQTLVPQAGIFNVFLMDPYQSFTGHLLSAKQLVINVVKGIGSEDRFRYGLFHLLVMSVSKL